MKNILTLLLLITIMTLTGCGGEKDAQEYSRKLAIVLKNYQTQVDAKLQAEQEAYSSLAYTYASAKEFNELEALQIERVELAQKITDELMETKKVPSLSKLRDLLRSYATADFNITRKIMERESLDNIEFLATLDNLEFETKKVEKLQKMLEELGKPKSRFQQLKELATLAQEVNKEYEKLACTDLANQIKSLSEEKDNATSEEVRTSLQAQIEQLLEEQQSKGCQ